MSINEEYLSPYFHIFAFINSILLKCNESNEISQQLAVNSNWCLSNS